MELKIALITNQSIHHKYWAFKLYKNLNIKLIVHPKPKKDISLFFKKFNKVFEKGFIKAFLKIVSISFNNLFRVSRKLRFSSVSRDLMGDYDKYYSTIPQHLFHYPQNINDDSLIQIIKDADIDYIFFLGGGIAKDALIKSPNYKTLNFHSGISPYYNGNKTNFHAFRNKDFNLIGGTLMYMSEEIDRGDILIHTFPEINLDDNSSTLFLKNIELSVQAFIKFIEKHISGGSLPSSVIQGSSSLYFKNIDWDIRDDIALWRMESSFKKLNIKRNRMIVDYFDLENHQIEVLKKRIEQIISKNKI